MVKEYKNFINGKWVKSELGKVFIDRNPANTDDVIGKFQKSTKKDIIQAIESAKKAFPGYRATPAPKRGKILLRAAQIMESQVKHLSVLLTREEGKPVHESEGEVKRAIQIFQYFGSEGWRLNGEVTPSEDKEVDLLTYREPLGVVALITPWNFPVCTPCWKIAPALVSGNTIVFKPASNTPLTGIRIVEILEEAGLPKGVLNLITGSGNTIGDEVTCSAEVRAISFTGSNKVGSKLYQKAARQMQKVQFEMGGKNPIIVLEDADINKSIDYTIQGAFGGTGQKCTATSRVIIVDSVADRFTEELIKRTMNIRIGNGMDRDTDMGPLIDKTQVDTVLKYIEVGKQEGAKLLFGGKKLAGPKYDKGYFVEPTIFGEVNPEMRIAQEEIFGPVLAVITVSSITEAIRVANNIAYGLSASVCTRDITKVFKCIHEIEAGIIHVNSTTTGAEGQVPFGGIKRSSSGSREMGKVAVDFYTQLKTVYLNYQ